MSIFKKRKDSGPSTPQFADEDPNSPLRKLPLDAQKEFLASNLSKDEVIKEWDIFMQCIYFQCRAAFEKPPPEVLKKRDQLQGESAPAAAAATPQRVLDPNNRPSLTRKRSGTCPAIFPSESDKAAFEKESSGKTGNETTDGANKTDKERKPKRDRSTSDKDQNTSSDAKTPTSDRKRAKSGTRTGKDNKEINAEDAEQSKVTRKKRSISALKAGDLKATKSEDVIKIEVIDAVRAHNSDGKIVNDKKKSDLVASGTDSTKIDESSRKDSSSQIELKASTSSEKVHSGSEEKKKDESGAKKLLVASNNSVEALGEAASVTVASSSVHEDNGTPVAGSPRESPKGEKSSDLPRSSSGEKIKEKSSKRRKSKPMDTDIVTTDTKTAELKPAEEKIQATSLPSSPAAEKKHKKRSSSNSSSKKDKDKTRTKTPDRDRPEDQSKSKLQAIPETNPLPEPTEKKSKRKSSGQALPNKENKVEKDEPKIGVTIVVEETDSNNNSIKDANKSQNEPNAVTSKSNSKTTSLGGNSSAVGPKKRRTSLTMTQEEMDKIFIKANPKDFFSISHKIGKGAFATVHIGKSLNKGEKNKRVAIKVAVLNDPKEKDPKKKSKANINLIANEIRLLNSCQHPNIVKHIGSYQYKDQIWTVMEYCDGGTLKDLLRVQLSENHIAFVMRDIISAVSYLHDQKRIHRDLKSDNILLNVNADVKIADLGLSIELDEADDDNEIGIAGSRFWLAPEMIRGDGYGVKADIWSLGCVAVEMADGRPPHYSHHPLKAIFYTATKGFPGLRQPDKWSATFRDFLSKCFEFDPSKRATAAELSQHPFLGTASSRREMAEMLKMAFMLKVTEGLEY